MNMFQCVSYDGDRSTERLHYVIAVPCAALATAQTKTFAAGYVLHGVSAR